MAKKRDLFKTLNKGVLKEDKGIIKTTGIKQNITILPELLHLIPPLRADEFEALEQNILKNGCRDALLVWEKDEEYVLIDGHNRHGICTKHGLDFNIKLLHFSTMEEVREYMIDNQLGRRNLTPEQASYLRGLKYNNEKKEKGKYERAEQKGQNVPFDSGTTSGKLAKEFNVSEKTIKRDALYAEGLEKIGEANAALKQDILAGKVKVKKGDIQAMAKLDRVGEINSVEDILTASSSKTAAVETSTPPANLNFEKQKKKAIRYLNKMGIGEDNQKLYEKLLKELEKLKKEYIGA
ncbi:hypothetical protein R9208_29555 [Flammeovirgaceae bacterium SG7u.132]|nr:hypothetical protein [Flammeovirgaceae bacterium SG7u.132]